MADQYTLTFVNNSKNDWTFCCYQTDPQIGPADVRSLAWYTKVVASGSEVDFIWTIDYTFVWSEMGEVIPGVVFKASQKLPAGLKENNAIDFTRISNSAFKFINQTTDRSAAGSLVIHQDDKIPHDTSAVGIGMGKAGTFIVPAQPSIDVSFSPHPKYWVTFGDYVTGEVLDTQQVTKKAEVPYAVNVYAMYAILGDNNQWKIASTPQVNSARRNLAAADSKLSGATLRRQAYDALLAE